MNFSFQLLLYLGNIILDEAEDLNIPLREEFVLHLRYRYSPSHTSFLSSSFLPSLSSSLSLFVSSCFFSFCLLSFFLVLFCPPSLPPSPNFPSLCPYSLTHSIPTSTCLNYTTRYYSACIMSISMKAIRAKQKAAARKESAKRTENKTETVTRVRRKSVEMRNLSNSPGKNNSTSATTSIGEGSAKIADLEEGNLEKSFGNYDESIRIDRDRERDRERDRDGGQIDVDDDEIDFGSGSDAESDSGSVQYDEGFDDGDLDDGGNTAASISLYFFFSLFLSSFIFSYTLAHSHMHSYTHTLTVIHFTSHTLYHTFIHTLTHSRIHKFTLAPILSTTLPPIHTDNYAPTHSITHSLVHSLTPAYTPSLLYPYSLSLLYAFTLSLSHPYSLSLLPHRERCL